jgi:UDP-2-acetamido-3-amino-2,3-dideoxy-glucuronate N-acetyltransferase
MFTTVNSLCLTKMPNFSEDNGDLVAIEGSIDIPFEIARVFVVSAPNGAVRGRHAHRACSQLLTCTSGTIEVICDDGQRVAEFVLSDPSDGLLVPPGIWSQQTYRGVNATLIALCDRRFELNDYIRDYEIFKAFRRDIQIGGTE